MFGGGGEMQMAVEVVAQWWGGSGGDCNGDCGNGCGNGGVVVQVRVVVVVW